MNKASQWPVLGLGTWRMGEAARARRSEIAAVRRAIELGYRLIDTAEMYGDGGAEEVVGAAVAEALRAGDCRRDELVIVSKVLPSNASTRGVTAACDRSRARLGLDAIDLYLLHWPGPHPLAATIDSFEALRARDAIQRWGVSNFDLRTMQRLVALPGGDACATNQVCYSLAARRSPHAASTSICCPGSASATCR
jgi:diketogulonate reductase-like aldo/keto reductase